MAPTTAIQAQDAQPPASLPSDALNRQSPLPRGCESFQVYDEQGRIWPPGFVSQLLDIDGPHTILRTAQYGPEAAKKRAATKAKKANVWGVPT